MINPDSITLTPTAFVPATTHTFTLYPQGEVELVLRVDACHRETAMQFFASSNLKVTLTKQQEESTTVTAAPAYLAHLAKLLRRSAFFRTPAVWRAIGPEEAFLDWIRQQCCAYCAAVPSKQYPTQVAPVRCVIREHNVNNFQLAYSALPLCHKHYTTQHIARSMALGWRVWSHHKRYEYVLRWAWESLKHQLGFHAWTAIPPTILHHWATVKGVQDYLPPEYCV